MKILCIIDGLGPGGKERQLAGLSILLKNKSYDVTVLAWNKCENDFRSKELIINGVKLLFDFKLQRSTTRIYYLYRHIRSLLPDVVISYYEPASVLLCIIHKLYSPFKLIVSERNFTQQISIYDRIRFSLYCYANYIVPNSHTQASLISKVNPKLKKRIHVITNFTDLNYFQYSLPKVENKCLIVARITEQKNTLFFIEVISEIIKRYPDFSVDWYGSSQDKEYLRLCYCKIRELHIEDKFIFHEPKSEMINIYKNATFLCLPSIYEGYPNVICEAMSCGLPVVCSDVCDNSFLIKSGINGYLFNPFSVKDMVKTICIFLETSEDERKKMSESNRQKAETLFSSDLFINRYEKLFR